METIDINERMNIFIMRGPGIFDSSKAEAFLDRINDDINENPELENDPLINSIADSMYKLSKEKGLVDYSGCDSFWIADETELLNGQGITLVEQDNTVHKKETFENYDKLSEKFIDFREFLSEAKYVGRYFKRTAKIEGRDISYMEEDESTLVLFATEYHMLIQYEFLGKKSFEMLSPRYFEDGNFEYYGEKHDEYNDKDEMFKAIEKQLTDKKKNTL